MFWPYLALEVEKEHGGGHGESGARKCAMCGNWDVRARVFKGVALRGQKLDAVVEELRVDAKSTSLPASALHRLRKLG